MNDNPLDSLPQNEWDALILSILTPLLPLCNIDALITTEDLQQEAWIGLLAACDRYDARKAKFVTYAYHYIRGHCMRYILKKTRNKPTQVNADPVDVDPRGYYDHKVERQDMMATILTKVKDEKHADLLVEHFVNNKSFRFIAKERGVSHETIAMRVNKLLDMLHIRLNHENA